MKKKGQIDILEEIVVDLFAGGGGWSTGFELATGRVVNIAVNHDPDAVLMHRTNHPYTEHFCEDVFEVDPEHPRFAPCDTVPAQQKLRSFYFLW